MTKSALEKHCRRTLCDAYSRIRRAKIEPQPVKPSWGEVCLLVFTWRGFDVGVISRDD